MSFSNYIGQTLDGKYKIEHEIGRGGMGTVFFAAHVGTERPVAVKVIAPQFMQRAEFVERFRREARAAGRLRHPNVVNVTDFGITDSVNGRTAYLVMEYLDGCTLGEILEEEKRLPLEWTLDILEQVCSAVQVAHEQGIIHRDLKPDNIWLEPNQRGGYTVKVLDFGIAKLEESSNEIAAVSLPPKPLPSSSSARATVADTEKGETVSEPRGATQIGESGTIAQFAESKTLISEAGTMIQTIEPLAEDKTAIFDSNENEQTALFDKNEEKRTAIFNSEEIGTKIISEQFDTDRHAGKKDTDEAARKTNELTRVGAVLGTPLFMSPEQCRGERLTARSDIYSLGVIAYRMLGSKTPFDGDHTQVMSAHQELEPPPLEAKGVPRRVKKVISRTLSKNPDERPQTAEAFASKMRSHSEGFAVLLQKALVIYSQHLPKFLLLALILWIPGIILNFIKLGIRALAAGDVISIDIANILQGVIGFFSFFIQIFAAALLVGTTTWIIAQILAVPLRPVSLRAALKAAKSRAKSLFAAVTFQSLLSMFGMALIVPGIYWSTVYMLVAPTIMMEGIKGRAAFRRSKALVKRAALTALTLTILTHAIPFIIGGAVGIALARATKPAAVQTLNAAGGTREDFDEEKLDINIGPNGVKVTNNKTENALSEAEKQEQRMRNFKRDSVAQSLVELVLTPLMLILTSLFAVVTALMYFKTRQAGGETMQGLLEQFEEKDQPRKKWQERVRHRLIQSGRITSGTSKS